MPAQISKSKVYVDEGDLRWGYLTIDKDKWIEGSGGVLGRVVGELEDRQLLMPLLVVLAAVGTEEVRERLVQSLHLSIALMVVAGRVEHLGDPLGTENILHE